MARLPKQEPGEVRDGLVLYPGGKTWHYQVRWRGQKRQGNTTCETRSAAVEWLEREKQKWRDEEQGILPALKIPTLERAARTWHEAHKHKLSANHLRNVMSGFMKHMTELHSTPLNQLDTGKVDGMISAYLAKGGSHGGANVVLRSLNCIVGYAIKIGAIQAKPYATKLLRVQEVPKPRLSPLKIADIFHALEEVGAPQQVKHLVLLMLGLGLRREEARSARVECLDLERETFIPWDPVRGTKGKEADALPLPEWLLPYLKRMKGDRTEGYLIPGAREERTGVMLANVWIKRIAEKLGIPDLTPHVLRATYATMLSEHGASPQSIQKAMRHKQLKTTSKYLIPDMDKVKTAMDEVGRRAGLSPNVVPTEFKIKK